MNVPAFLRSALFCIISLSAAAPWLEARTLRLVVTGNEIMGSGALRLMLDSDGNEHRVTLSITYEKAVLRFDNSVAGIDVGAGGNVTVTSSTSGSYGILGIDISRAAGAVFEIGSRELAALNFTVVAPAQASTYFDFSSVPLPTAFTAANGGGLGGSFLSTAVTAHPATLAPMLTSAGAASFYAGDPVSFQVTATGRPAPTFSVVGGSFPTWATLDATSGLLGGTPPTANGSPFTFTIRASNGIGSSPTQSFTLTIIDPTVGPAITLSPVPTTVFQGRPATLTAAATGSPVPTFQWRQDGVAVPGATSASLALGSAQAADAGSYDVVVTNRHGSITSGAVALTVLPLSTLPIVATALGWRHALYLGADGVLLATGDNSAGQLGDGTSLSRITPFVVATGVTAVAADGFKSYFLKANGTAWAMGMNFSGALGEGSTTHRSIPVQVALDRVVALAPGAGHLLLLRFDGSLWTVGQNDNGQLGDGATVNRSIPVQIATGVSAISAGGFTTFFLKADRTLWACGSNTSGELGDGSTTKRNIPVRVASSVDRIAAGDFHTMFVKTNGSLWGMGNGLYAALANGSVASSSSPVLGISAGVASVAAGSDYTLFVKSDGALFGVGRNDNGQLGTGSTAIQQFSPFSVATGVASAEAATNHSRFLKLDGTLWATGDNTYGHFGDGTKTSRLAPVQLFPTPPAIAAPSAPSDVQATDRTTPGQMRITWTPVVGATRYEVWRSLTPVVTDAVKLTDSVPIALYFDTAVTTGTTYYYWIKAAAFSATSTFSSAPADSSAVPPMIVTAPEGRTVLAGASVSLSVSATGTPPPTYQWRRGGQLLAGATAATLTIPVTTVADAGNYDVVIANSAGTVTSATVTLTVNAPPAFASAAAARFIVGRGGSFMVSAVGLPAPTVSHSGGALPPWLTFNTATGALTANAPDAAGSPFTLVFTANNGIGVPATQTVTLTVQPGHSADVSPADGALNLVELTRVIELYNTRSGTLRTGRYVVSASSVDGYAPDPSVTAGPIPLTPHTADLNRDGRLSLTELTRVIELFNTRVGTVRSGAYHVATTPSEDGFAPGP